MQVKQYCQFIIINKKVQIMTHIFSAIIEAAAIEVASPIMRLKYSCQTSISSKMECVVRCVD